MNVRAQLVVKFERDLEAVTYVYLGQISILQIIDLLLEEKKCKLPLAFMPRYSEKELERRVDEWSSSDDEDIPCPLWDDLWFKPEDGLKTATCLLSTLDLKRVEQMGLSEIISEVRTELNDWIKIMTIAVEKNVLFRLNYDRSCPLPAKLTNWCDKRMNDTRRWFADAAKDARSKVDAKKE